MNEAKRLKQCKAARRDEECGREDNGQADDANSFRWILHRAGITISPLTWAALSLVASGCVSQAFFPQHVYLGCCFFFVFAANVFLCGAHAAAAWRRWNAVQDLPLLMRAIALAHERGQSLQGALAEGGQCLPVGILKTKLLEAIMTAEDASELQQNLLVLAQSFPGHELHDFALSMNLLLQVPGSSAQTLAEAAEALEERLSIIKKAGEEIFSQTLLVLVFFVLAPLSVVFAAEALEPRTQNAVLVGGILAATVFMFFSCRFMVEAE